MIGQFLGTSAAEGIPAQFCRCPVCCEAREKGIVAFHKLEYGTTVEIGGFEVTYDVRELIGRLYRQGTLNGESVVYLTHINHHTSHTEMPEAVKSLDFPVRTVVTYDGMTVF